MKFLLQITLVFGLAAGLFSCEKEVLQPESPSVQLRGNSGIVRPASQCGSSAFSSITDAQGGNHGTVEIANDGTNIHTMITLSGNRFLEEAKFFVGDLAAIEYDADGINFENFPFQSVFSAPQNRYTFINRYAGLGECTELVFWGRVSTRNQFGAVTSMRDVWFNGVALQDIASVKYCPSSCGAASQLGNPN